MSAEVSPREVSPRTKTSSVWTQLSEKAFIRGMGTGTGDENDKYIDRSALTDWDRLMLRRKLLIRYINALGRRSRWEPKTRRGPQGARGGQCGDRGGAEMRVIRTGGFTVRVGRGAIVGYVLGLATAAGFAIWFDTDATWAVMGCWAAFVPQGYWWGRQDESEESGP